MSIFNFQQYLFSNFIFKIWPCCAKSPDFESVNKAFFFKPALKSGDFGDLGAGIQYINYYNNDRIRLNLKAKSPIEYRTLYYQ
ncbi:IS3 family transposase [Chryseobacterium contaminans]|uniref:IS3 family transposase n=1 Tax=Chryseobacterium contaminans TaxID=1423959 RepID=UPI003AFA29E0